MRPSQSNLEDICPPSPGFPRGPGCQAAFSAIIELSYQTTALISAISFSTHAPSQTKIIIITIPWSSKNFLDIYSVSNLLQDSAYTIPVFKELTIFDGLIDLKLFPKHRLIIC